MAATLQNHSVLWSSLTIRGLGNLELTLHPTRAYCEILEDIGVRVRKEEGE